MTSKDHDNNANGNSASSYAQIFDQLECKLGEHNIFLYPTIDMLRQFYPFFCKRALEENNVVVLLSYYEPVKTVYTYLENYGIDGARYKRENSLFVLDTVEQFFGSHADFFNFLKILDQGVAKHKKNGVCVIVNADAFHMQGSIADLINYEKRIHEAGKLTHTSILCMYHTESFTTLQVNDQEMIAQLHDHMVK